MARPTSTCTSITRTARSCRRRRATRSDENINTCLPAATYYVKVNGYGHARSEYLLAYDKTAETCDTACVDDTRRGRRHVQPSARDELPDHTATAQKICTNDDDWYKVRLYDGEKLTMDLTFTQTASTQDLDIHLFKDFTDLWPCSPTDPSTCETAHGQGAELERARRVHRTCGYMHLGM